jgi:hypothetical protein
MKKLSLGILLACWMLVQVSGQDAITNSVVALVSSARYQVGTSSLIMSSELISAAQRHSNDMAQTGQLDHVGSDGSQFWERMTDAGYSLTTGAENILLRSDMNAQAIFNQWRNSPPHQANMMNPDYVEVGVAYAQSADGTYFVTMVLGTRAGVSAPILPSPTQIPPTFTPLPPTATSIPPTVTLTPIPTATYTATPLIQPTRTLSPLITPVYFTPIPTITPPILPTATPELPPDIRLIYDTDSLTLLNVAGRRLDLTGLRFPSDTGLLESTVWDTDFLTERLNNFSDGDCLQVWGLRLNVVQDKISDCKIRHAWVAVKDTQLFWTNASSFLVLNDGDIIGQCIVADGRCDISFDAEFTLPVSDSILSTPSNRDIRLMFNQDSLTVLSLADSPINLLGLSFQSSGGTLSIQSWETEFLTSSLSGFPSQDCLMAWTSQAGEQPQSVDCKTRHGWIVVGDDDDFWRGVSRFDVIRDNRVLAGCVVASGYCDVNLAGNLGINSPTLVPLNPVISTGTSVANTTDSSSLTTSNAGLTLVYSLDSFALINTSGRSLDLSEIVFESDTGVFSANRWNTDFLTRPLSDFPSGDCLQIWGVNEELQSKPTGCNTRHSWVAVASDVQFWRNTSQLRVRYGAEQLGLCDLNVGQCAIRIP